MSGVTPRHQGRFRQPKGRIDDKKSAVPLLAVRYTRFQHVESAEPGEDQMEPSTRIPAACAGFTPRQAGNDPRDVRLTITRRRSELHRHP